MVFSVVYAVVLSAERKDQNMETRKREQMSEYNSEKRTFFQQQNTQNSE